MTQNRDFAARTGYATLANRQRNQPRTSRLGGRLRKGPKTRKVMQKVAQ